MAGRRVRRKNGAANLTQQSASASASASAGSSVSLSSATSGLSSTPPPLSPSYSLSAMSQGSETEAGSGSGSVSVQEGQRMRNGKMVSRSPHPLETETLADYKRHNTTSSDSLLAQNETQPATVFHDGASFQILNPRHSLRFARIVSYIEDVDYIRDDAGRGPWLGSTGGIMEEDNDDDDAVGLSNRSAGQRINQGEAPIKSADAEHLAHLDIVGDAPIAPIPSISERLGGYASPESHDFAEGNPTEETVPYENEQQPLISKQTYPHTEPGDPQQRRDCSFPLSTAPGPQLFGPVPAGDMANIHSFQFPGQMGTDTRPAVEGRAGRRKLARSKSAACMQEETGGGRGKSSGFRPFRWLRQVVRAV
ncbi:hypothetical protein PHISP_02074 [Aspergillus sp. HF37]|nr:hypothetical protein PHISP_02074 [Aspergillus sp. HF37]